ncbi:hypothetical protein TIFTF001_025389 [Ficus carica]|uniref:Uncharacterized protein n=1 Tax=Ficus carica TaxID=3494 RepID=A0AA88DH85_FICCA|nr:hypothetical protein TIFTF001_025389 [Ficus carica]
MVVSVGKNWPQKFLIDAANLQHFSYYRMSDPPDSVSFLNCKSLSSLCIGCNFNTAWAIDEFISQLPLLENLTLTNSGSRIARKSIQISHTNLKSLTFNGRWCLSETEIYTPNLRFFRYRGRIFHFPTFRYCSGYLDAKLHLLDGSSLCSGWFWFIKLRNFLESFSNCRVLTLFCNLAFDENRSFSLVWEAITGTSNANEKDTLFQYIKAAVDKIEKQLNMTVEKIRMEQKLCIRNLS